MDKINFQCWCMEKCFIFLLIGNFVNECSLMLTLLKSLVIALLEYCCSLWNPWKAKDIQAIEACIEGFRWCRTFNVFQSYSTNVYIQNHRSTALKLLGKTARTQIYSLQSVIIIFGIYIYCRHGRGNHWSDALNYFIFSKNHRLWYDQQRS